MKMKPFSFAITAEENVIGSIGVFRQGNIHRRTAELGYYIAEEYWGKGIMREAVKQICRYVFDKERYCPHLCGAVCTQCGVLSECLKKQGFNTKGH